MADAKRNPKKMRKPLMWLRRRVPVTESPKPDSSGESTRRDSRPWYRPTLLKASAIILGLLVLLPMRAKGQFGIDTAAILAALSKLQSLMTS